MYTDGLDLLCLDNRILKYILDIHRGFDMSKKGGYAG